MSWNYRILEREYTDGTKWLGIYEVYYDDEGNPQYCSSMPVAPYGDNLEDIAGDLQSMIEAISKPTLLYSDFVKREEVTDV